MTKLIRYLKPYTLSIFLIVVLLFMQAMTDLSLPDYMSRIVNVGLQQSGIQDAIPMQLRVEQLDRLLVLTDPNDHAQIESIYDRDSQTGLARLDSVSLDQMDPLVRQHLSDGFLHSILILSAVESGQLPVLDKLPPGTSAWDGLTQLPDGQRQLIIDQLTSQTAGSTQAVAQQAASVWIKAEYDATGYAVDLVQRRYILSTGGWMLLIAMLGVLFSIGVGFLSSRVGSGLAHDLRSLIFRKVEQFSSTELDHFSTASLITRTTNDIQQIQQTFMILIRSLFFAPMMAIGGVLKIIGGDVSMVWIIALAVVALLTLIVSIFTITMPKFKLIQKLVDRLNLVMREILSGLMVTRAFNTQRQMQDKFAKANRDLTELNLFVSRSMVIMMPLMMLIMNFTSIAVVWVGARQIDLGMMQVGDMMAFLQYATTIIFSFLMVSIVFIMMPRASVSALRIVEVIETDLSIVDPVEPTVLPSPVRGRIEFNDVSFKYPGADDPVLCHISLTAEPGQTTAFIGSTGSGKSTLVNLIPRFYDVSEGQILLDGVDIRQLSQHALHEAIGYVPQKGILFTGDIASNISYGRPGASTDEIKDAAATAQVLDYIKGTNEQFASVIAQGGANVSGGQKQRLSIARALAKQAPIYIFDDSFSALDYQTDAALRKALHEKTAASTILIVAQRIGTIRNADQIVVLDQGQIVGIGQHRELLENCPVYAEIAASQLSAEELAL